MKAPSAAVLLAVMLPAQAVSMCALGGYSVWPPPGSVPRNTVLLVEARGYLSSSRRWASVGAAELRGGGEAIRLEPIQRFRGRGGEQVLFRPVRRLTPGVEYELFVPGLEDGPLTHITFDLPGFVPLRWVAQETEDLTPPVWVGRPRVVAKRYIDWACGSEIEVDVQLPTRESGALLALAELTPTGATRGEPQTHLLRVVDGVVSVGHGMCGGAFDVEPGGEYLLRPVLIDVAGHRAEAWTEPLAFRVKSEPDPPSWP